MNTMQQEPLFTDLTLEQAETVTAAGTSTVNASYGFAVGSFDRIGSRSFKVSVLNVKDKARDGDAVYAKFQGRATDGTILITPTKRLDSKGADGPGTRYTNLTGSFSKNISQMRVAIYRQNRGRDLVNVGNWTTL